MMRSLRVAVAALLLLVASACAALHLDDPLAAAKTPDQEAYALMETYAAMLEEGAKLAADPAAPASVKRSLAGAEAVATPAVQSLKAALEAHLDAERAGASDPAAAARAAAAIAEAAARLADAIAAAQGPIRAVQAALAR